MLGFPVRSPGAVNIVAFAAALGPQLCARRVLIPFMRRGPWRVPARLVKRASSSLASPAESRGVAQRLRPPSPGAFEVSLRRPHALAERKGPRRAKSVKEIDRGIEKVLSRDAANAERSLALAAARAKETSLRFHLFRLERPMARAEIRRASRHLHPCRELPRLRPSELLAFVEGGAQRHARNPLAWALLERRACAFGRIYSPGEMARLASGFARARGERAPTRLLRRCSERLQREVGQCSLEDVAHAAHAFGAFGVRDRRLLRAISAALPPLLDLEAQAPSRIAAVARLCEGLAALRWPDATALRFAADLLRRALAPARGPPLVTALPGLGPKAVALNLFTVPSIEEGGQLREEDVLRILEAFAIFEVRSMPALQAALADVARVHGAPGKRARTWRLPEHLGGLGASLARVGVLDTALSRRWLAALRRSGEGCGLRGRTPGELRAVAETAALLGVFRRDFQLALGRELPRSLNLRSQAVSVSVRQGHGRGTELVECTTHALGSAPCLVSPMALVEALRCASRCAYLRAQDLLAVLGAARTFLARDVAGAAESAVLLEILSLCSSADLPREVWPCSEEVAFARLDAVPARLLGTGELLEVHRCSAALAISGRSRPLRFEDRCPRLARALHGRLAAHATALPREADPRAERALVSLASFAAVAGELGRQRPTALGGDRPIALSARRALRACGASEAWAPPSLGAALVLLRCCALAPLPGAMARRSCDFVARHAALLQGTALCSALRCAALCAGRDAAWGRLLAALVAELAGPRLQAVPAGPLLSTATALLAASRARPARPRRPLRRARQGAALLLGWAADRPAIFASAPSSTLLALMRLGRRGAWERTRAGGFRSAEAPDVPFIDWEGAGSPEPPAMLGWLHASRVASRSGCLLGRCVCGGSRACSRFAVQLRDQVALRGLSPHRAIGEECGVLGCLSVCSPACLLARLLAHWLRGACMHV